MPSLGVDLLTAEVALMEADMEEATKALVRIAKTVFAIPPFVPNDLRDDWQALLGIWLAGDALPHEEGDGLPRFVEDAFVYRLVWALEVIRLRSDLPDAEDIVGYSGDDVDISRAALAVETGTSRRSDALLLRAGLGSREAARAAVDKTAADFETRAGLRAWRLSPQVRALQKQADWPTPETRAVWQSFRDSIRKGRFRRWRSRTSTHGVDWVGDVPDQDTLLSLRDEADGETGIYSVGMYRLGTLKSAINADRQGVTVARMGSKGKVILHHIGPQSVN